MSVLSERLKELCVMAHELDAKAAELQQEITASTSLVQAEIQKGRREMVKQIYGRLFPNPNWYVDDRRARCILEQAYTDTGGKPEELGTVEEKHYPTQLLSKVQLP